ncbi:MAG: hypothetical protein Q9213_001618 [Squamulea squamosa]
MPAYLNGQRRSLRTACRGMTDQQRAFVLDMQEQLETQGFRINNPTIKRLEDQIDEQVIVQADRVDHQELASTDLQALSQHRIAFRIAVAKILLDALPKIVWQGLSFCGEGRAKRVHDQHSDHTKFVPQQSNGTSS